MDIGKKDQFILDFYKIAWDNVNAHRDGLWKILIPYLGFYVVIGDIYGLVGKIGIILIFMGLNTFVMAISVNFNLWFVRNVAIISNIESFFLEDSDYNKLIPEGFKRKLPFGMLELWIFIFYCILIIHLLTFLMSFFILDNCYHMIISSIVFFVTTAFIVWWYFKHKERYDKFASKAIGYKS